MSYWACARLELRREAVAQHFLKLNGYETYIPRVREQRLRRGKRIETISPYSGEHCRKFVEVGNGEEAELQPEQGTDRPDVIPEERM